MIQTIDLCRELLEALDSNSQINRATGAFSTVVDPTFFARLRAACAEKPMPAGTSTPMPTAATAAYPGGRWN